MDWRIMLCDVDGSPLSNITSIAKEKSFQFKLNRPARFTFNVPSDSPLINTMVSPEPRSTTTNAAPYLDVLRRTIKAYRKELQDDGTSKYVIRFAGYVWQIQDEGDTDNATTTVTVFDPMQRMERNFARQIEGDGSVNITLVTFTNTDGIQIAKTIIDRASADTNAFPTYPHPTGVTTSGGTFEVGVSRSVKWEYKSLGDAILELSNAYNGFDVVFDPLDQQDGVLAKFSAFNRRGSFKPNVVFGWGIAPHNVQHISRLMDGSTVMTRSLFRGGTAESEIKNGPNQSTTMLDYGVHYAQITYTDITIQSLLDQIAAEQGNIRGFPKELVNITPQYGNSPLPWTDFNLGDTVNVFAGERLRGGFAGIQRIYGFDLKIDNEGGEHIDSIVTSPEA